MPSLPPSHRPAPARKPFANSRTAAKRLRGRRLLARNDRIKRRDAYTCQACGRVTEHGEVDHKIPLAQGGDDSDGNLQWLCAGPQGCHLAKTMREQGQKPKARIGVDGWPID